MNETAYIYFLDYSICNLYNYLSEHKDELTGNSKDLFDAGLHGLEVYRHEGLVSEEPDTGDRRKELYL